MSDKTGNQEFVPFADGHAVVTAGGLQIENGADEIALFGDLRLSRDLKSKHVAQVLAQVLLDIAASIGDDAPEEAASSHFLPEEEVPNPFA